jgi:cell division protein FtsB
MNRGLKITLIVVGSLAVAGGITYAIVRSIRKKKEEKEAQEKELQETPARSQRYEISRHFFQIRL